MWMPTTAAVKAVLTEQQDGTFDQTTLCAVTTTAMTNPKRDNDLMELDDFLSDLYSAGGADRDPHRSTNQNESKNVHTTEDDDGQEEVVDFVGLNDTQSDKPPVNTKEEDDNNDDDDLHSVVSFSSLSVDTFRSFDDLFHNKSRSKQREQKADRRNDNDEDDIFPPVISPGGSTTSATSSSSSSPLRTSTLTANKLWNDFQLQINKIPSIPTLLHHKDGNSSKNNSSSTVTSTANTAPFLRGDLNLSRVSIDGRETSVSTTTSLSTNVVAETLQSWMTKTTPSVVSVLNTPKDMEVQNPSLENGVEDDHDNNDGELGDGLDLPSMSSHTPRQPPQRLYGVPPKRQVTPPELQRQRPFDDIRLSSSSSSSWMNNHQNDDTVYDKPTDDDGRMSSIVVSPLPWISDHSSFSTDEYPVHSLKTEHNGSTDKENRYATQVRNDIVSKNNVGDDEDEDCDEMSLFGRTIFYRPADGTAADVADGNNSLLLEDEEFNLFDFDLDGDDPLLLLNDSSLSALDNDAAHIRPSTHLRSQSEPPVDKFSRLRQASADLTVARTCSFSSLDCNGDSENGSVHSSWSQSSDDDYTGSSEVVPNSDGCSNRATKARHGKSHQSEQTVKARRTSIPSNKSTSKSTETRKKKRSFQSQTISNKKKQKKTKTSRPFTTNSSMKPKRVRKHAPSTKEYVEPADCDVLMGRGGRSNHHPGNKVYRERVLSLQPKYKTLSRDQKTAMSRAVVEWVYKRGGKFLEIDKELGGNSQDGPWFISTDTNARAKVSQALREDHTKEGREAKQARRRGGGSQKKKGGTASVAIIRTKKKKESVSTITAQQLAHAIPV